MFPNKVSLSLSLFYCGVHFVASADERPSADLEKTSHIRLYLFMKNGVFSICAQVRTLPLCCTALIMMRIVRRLLLHFLLPGSEAGKQSERKVAKAVPEMRFA